jgi:hypothetical protein
VPAKLAYITQKDYTQTNPNTNNLAVKYKAASPQEKTQSSLKFVQW